MGSSVHHCQLKRRQHPLERMGCQMGLGLTQLLNATMTQPYGVRKMS
jgi:hypothetical protein